MNISKTFLGKRRVELWVRRTGKMTITVPERCEQQSDVRPGSKHHTPRSGQESDRARVVGVLGAIVRHRVHHGRPRGGPDEAEDGQRLVTAVVRHVRYDHTAEQVAGEATEQRAGKHARRVQAALRPGYDLAG